MNLLFLKNNVQFRNFSEFSTNTICPIALVFFELYLSPEKLNTIYDYQFLGKSRKMPCGKQMESKKEYFMTEAYQEFHIQRITSQKPVEGGELVNSASGLRGYENGMEHFILSPLAAFFLEENETSNLWFIIVLPKCRSDLEKFKAKHESKIDDECIRQILLQMGKALYYLKKVRTIRYQDLKPNNVLVDFEIVKKKIVNLRLKLTDFGLSVE